MVGMDDTKHENDPNIEMMSICQFEVICWKGKIPGKDTAK